MGVDTSKPERGSAITNAIMDRIIRNPYDVLIDVRISMRERHGLKFDQKGGAHDKCCAFSKDSKCLK